MSSFPYEDIINRQRPVHDGDSFSVQHPRMDRGNRAKIFAPFAALKGYEESVEEMRLSEEERINTSLGRVKDPQNGPI